MAVTCSRATFFLPCISISPPPPLARGRVRRHLDGQERSHPYIHTCKRISCTRAELAYTIVMGIHQRQYSVGRDVKPVSILR